MVEDIRWRGTQAQLRAIVQRLPGLLAGEERDPTGEVVKMYADIGRLVLELFGLAYDAKSAGGTDDAGEAWRELAPATIRRRMAQGTWPPERILIESERLYRSLKPAAAHTQGDTLLEVDADGAVTVGSRVPYAAAHHRGTPKLPQRRLWPVWSDWPEAWKGRVLDVIRGGTRRLLMALLQMESA